MLIQVSFRFVHRAAPGLCLLLIFLSSYALSQPITDQKLKENIAWFQGTMRVIEKQHNTDSVITALKLILDDAVHDRDNWKCTTVLLKIGEKYMDKGDFSQAMVCMKQAIGYSRSLPPIEVSNAYQHLGWVYFELGDYVTASENFYTALDYLKKNKTFFAPNQVSLCNDLGQVYSRLHENDKALHYYNEGEATALKNNLHHAVVFILYNKGEYYTSIHEPDSARKYYMRVNDVGDQAMQVRQDIKAMAMEGMGKTYLESGDYEQAAGYLEQAVRLTENKYNSIWTESSFFLGDALYRLKAYKRAESVLTAALKNAAANKLKDNEVNGYASLVAVYKATGQYARALDCMDSIRVLKDSLVSAEKAKAIILMDIKFQTAEKDKQIALQNSKIARKNMWIIAIGGYIILMLAVLLGLYLHMLNKNRSAMKENKIRILNAAVEGGDSERSRIARELHDGIGGMLSAAMMRFSSMYHDNAAIRSSPAYREAMNILREMGDEIRKTAHNLMPEVLLKQSLPEAVRLFCNAVQHDGTLKIDFQSYGSFDDLSQTFKLNLYRIVQELTRNVVLHARASHVLVQLLQTEDKLIVTVEDNGTGFNVEEARGGLGLHNVRTRASNTGGQLIIESVAGKGTTVIIEFGYAANRPAATAAEPAGKTLPV